MAVSILGMALLAPGLGGLGGLLPFLLLIPLLYLMIVPNQRKQKQWAATLAAIKSGDRVTTTGGIRGTVISIKDDLLVVRTQPDGVKLEIVKTAIAAVTTEEETKA